MATSDGRSTNANKEAGTQAEEYVAQQTGGTRTPNGTYDVETGSGRVAEVKSTQKRYDYDNRRGRFRLWKQQHQALKDEDGVYYFLVEGMPPARIKPDAIDRIMREKGLSWTDSGPSHDKGQQLKLNWKYVIDPE